MTNADALNKLEARLAEPSLSDDEAFALSDELAAIAETVITRPVACPHDLSDKVVALRIAVTREWDTVIPCYLEQIEANVRSFRERSLLGLVRLGINSKDMSLSGTVFAP